MRAALRTVLATPTNAASVTLLVTAREAEAAKCLVDPRVVLVVTCDEPGIRLTLSSLRPSLPVVWVAVSDSEGDAVGANVNRVRAMLDELALGDQPGSSA